MYSSVEFSVTLEYDSPYLWCGEKIVERERVAHSAFHPVVWAADRDAAATHRAIKMFRRITVMMKVNIMLWKKWMSAVSQKC